MSLIWHIVVKDLRRLRGSVALWAALIAAKLGIGLMLVWGVGRQFDSWALASYWTAGLEVLAGYLLVAAILHGDVLVGSQSFWMTRPISGTRLFAAKLAALAVVFGVIPLIVTLPWWLWCGYGMKEVGLAALETLGLQGLMIAAALPAASLTDGMSRYLFWTLIAVTALIGLASTFAGQPGSGLWATSLLLATSGVVGAGWHLLKRRFLAFGAVLGCAGAGALALGVVAFFGPSFPGQAPAGTQPVSPRVQSINFSYSGAAVEKRGATSLLVSLRGSFEGVPPELVLEGTAAHQWSWQEGLVLKRKTSLEFLREGINWHALGLQPPPRNAVYEERRNARRRQAGQPEFNLSDAVAPAYSQIFVPREFEKRVRLDPPSYSMRMDLALMRPVLMGEGSTEIGETIKSAAERSRIIARIRSTESTRSYRRGDGRIVLMTEPSPKSPSGGSPVTRERLYLALAEYRGTVLGGRDPFRGIGPFLLSGWPRRTYVVVNRARGNAVQEFSFFSHDTFRTRAVRIGTVGIVWRMLQVAPPSDYSEADDRWIAQSNWFEGVTLAKLELREEERFTKEFRVERFELATRGSTEETP